MQTFIDRYPKKDEAIKEIVSYILENPSGKVAVQCDSGKLAKQAGLRTKPIWQNRFRYGRQLWSHSFGAAPGVSGS